MEIIDIRGDIYSWTASDLRYNLSYLKGKAVVCRVQSYGGDVNQAMAIAQAMKDHGDVTVQLIGMNASAATWMVYGAKEVQMAEDALWLCHKTSTPLEIWQNYNADQIDDLIAQLEKQKKTNEVLDLVIAKKYANKSGKSVKDIMTLMEDEKWLTAKDVKDLGLIDKVIAPSGEITNHSKLIVQNCIDLKLPVPQLDVVEEKKKDDAQSLFEAIINKCKEMFAPKDAPKDETHNNDYIMNTSFATINNLLNVEGVEEKDGAITLNVEQFTAISNAIEKNAADAETLGKVVEVLNKVSGNESIEGAVNKAQALVNILDKIPAPVPAPVVPETKPENKEDEFADPINSIAKSI